MTKWKIGDLVCSNEHPEEPGTVLDVSLSASGQEVYKTSFERVSEGNELRSPALESMDNTHKKQIVMVTGGAGYVGSILVRELLKAGYGVVCLDNLKFGGESLTAISGHPNFFFHNIDLTQPAQVDQIFETYKFFAVIHLAAIVGDPACKQEPELAKSTNWDASVHLLQRAREKKVSRFIFASTCSNYGKMEDPGGFVREDSTLSPVSLYAELKVKFENLLLKEIEKDDSFSPTALRFSTVYGISPRMRFDLTVNEFAKELVLGRELVIFGEQFWRPYCHVHDFSRAMLTVLRAPREKVAYDVFNVGNTEQNYTKKMLADELSKQIPEATIRYVEKKEDPRDYRVNFEKIQKTLGFCISKRVPEGISEIVHCLRAGIINDPDAQTYYNIPYKRPE